MTGPVVVHVVFTPAEGALDRMVDALRAGIAEVHGEPGCELYSIHHAPDGTVVMIEKWTSAEELDTHGAGEPVARMNASLEGLLAEPPRIVRLDPIPAGTPEQGAL